MNKTNKIPFRRARWVMLSLAVIFNSFIIFYSCLDDKTTNSWSRFVSNIFTNIVNNFTKKEVKTVPVTGIEAGFTTYTYNNAPGYQKEEIPLGCEKEIGASILPSDATNKAVRFSTTDNDIVSLNQSGSKVTVIGLKEGTAVIKATSSNPNFYKEISVKVVKLTSPVSFDATLANNTIAMYHPEAINIVVNDAFNNELTDSRYYNFKQLSYRSDDDAIATVGNMGVITPVSEGSTTIRISNSLGVEKAINVTVTSGSQTPGYDDLHLIGDDYCYENDIFNNKKVSFVIKNGEETLDNSEFYWESSNPVLANVNQKGEVRGYRKTILEDETVTIKATNIRTHQEITKEIVIKKELPTKMYTCYVVGEKELWSHPNITAFVGNVVTVKVSYDKTVVNNDLTVNVTDESIVTYTNQGSNIILDFKKEGNVEVTINSNIVPSLSDKTEIKVMQAGAIDEENYENVHLSIRKSIGHATMFGITQVFTFLAIYMFFFEKKKWWILALISLGCGVLLASISELIQFFIPLRSGTFVDVLVDVSGVAVGLAITVGVLWLIKYLKNRKQHKKK